MGTVAKRYNSLGESLHSATAAFGPNGLIGRDVLEPAARASEKAPPELEAEIRELDTAKIEKHAERIEAKRPDAEAA
jgi:hypothetical protein